MTVEADRACAESRGVPLAMRLSLHACGSWTVDIECGLPWTVVFCSCIGGDERLQQVASAKRQVSEQRVRLTNDAKPCAAPAVIQAYARSLCARSDVL